MPLTTILNNKQQQQQIAKIKLVKGLKEAGALDAIRIALAKTKSDLFYRLRDVEGLDNRSSSPPLSPMNSPQIPPSYIVPKSPRDGQTSSGTSSPSPMSSLYSPAKLMSLFSPSSHSGNNTPTTHTPPAPHRSLPLPQNGRSTLATSTPIKVSPVVAAGRPYSSTYTSVSKSAYNDNNNNNSNSTHHPVTPARFLALPPERPCLLHFLYKDQKANQFTCPRMEAPYSSPEERKRLFRLYQHINVIATGAMWQSAALNDGGGGGGGGSSSPAKGRKGKIAFRPHKVYYHTSDRESILAWLTPGFELYATFSPMSSKANAIRICNQLLRWIKSEEEHLFVQNTPVW